MQITNLFFSAQAAAIAFQQSSMVPDLLAEVEDFSPGENPHCVRRTIQLEAHGKVVASHILDFTCNAELAIRLEHRLRMRAAILTSTVKAASAEYAVKISTEAFYPGA